MPAEMARGIYMRNSPSLQALKLLHLMIGTAGGRMADDVRHEIRLANIRAIEGMKNHDRASIRPLFEELRGVVMTFDDPAVMQETIGGIIDHAVIDYRHEATGEILVSWYFGRMFRDMAEKSNHWAILDRQTVFHLTSKYSVLLFQHIASLVNLQFVNEKTFSVPELRALLGVTEGKQQRFADLNRNCLQLAIEEINHLSRFTLKATPKKIGRTVVGITISWAQKADRAPVAKELGASKVGRKARQQGASEAIYEPFPSEGSIHFTKWAKLARDHIQVTVLPDLGMITNQFREFAGNRKLDLKAHNIEQAFINWCGKYTR
ncbi:hypothetical protein QR680_019443 [Steinernema hermaphroditum]|uniref:Initiator Rep protein WH1 domain-containing protein n=1 Tax=Steinernema hermaphroditum TaxID=289476 RepID=A0AA39LAR9_9BILA|nr:hypothetical protein QR680_019443 [Steinernema hermaphroditum]